MLDGPFPPGPNRIEPDFTCQLSSEALHFLFISTFLGNPVGGTETLMARMSKWLLNRGHQVTVFANSVQECAALFDKGVELSAMGDRFGDLCFRQKARRLWEDSGIRRPDVIKSFDLMGSWVASVIASQLKPTPKAVFGNYFPYLISSRGDTLRFSEQKLFLANLRRCYSDSSILCMSKEQISEFQEHYGAHRSPKFWPLPVEDPSLGAPLRAPKFGHIVSVGRLAPMKEYNLYMTEIIAKLRQKGCPVRWTVYGEGDFAGAMKARIAELGLDGNIELKGNLPYARLAEALHDAYLFVGMGTASIEAALCGVPTVVALAHDTTGVTYGPLYRFTFGNVGERMETPPHTTVEAEIERLLKLSGTDYATECARTRHYARQYEMDRTMERFVRICQDAQPAKPSQPLFYWYYLYSIGRRCLKPRVRNAP